ncbi:MAG: hypothetical protein JKY90_03090 [Gammaproteobacteria bacterium]|nr:hypothetical protein [Gammaproteobacteria bacterium]
MGNFSNNLGQRVLNRGQGKGHCVICGVYGELSRDHIPPKKCNNLNDVELKALLPSGNSARVATTSQGGEFKGSEPFKAIEKGEFIIKAHHDKRG